MTVDAARKLALSFEEAEEMPHFERTSFRVNKKIFATMDEKSGMVCIMLTPVDQSVFTTIDKNIIYPVPNAWGKKGATYMVLKKLSKSILKDALTRAYCRVAPNSLAVKYIL